MSPSAVLQQRPVRSPIRERQRPTPNDAPTAMRPSLTHQAERLARQPQVPRHVTSLAPDRQPGRDSNILRSFHVPPQTNRWFYLQEHVQRLQDHPVLESIALESLNLSFPRMRESILGSTCGFPPARERRRGQERRKRQSHPAACHSRVCGNPFSSFPVISGQRSCHSGLPCSIRFPFHWRFHFLMCFLCYLTSLMPARCT